MKVDFQKWLPCIVCVLLVITISVFFYRLDFTKYLKPRLIQIDEKINDLEKQNVDSLINIMNGIFLLNKGYSTIKVGINNNLENGDATIFKNEEIDFLEVDASFHLTNPRNVLKPCVEIKIIEERSREGSEADLFIGLDAAEMLGIKGEMLNIGIFNMGIRRIGN